jgi:D-alanyl-D-alanine dipeptidase
MTVALADNILAGALSCQGSVPEAITAFLESESYEDAVRKAVSLGGDSDTIACITGGIAHGVLRRRAGRDPVGCLPAPRSQTDGRDPALLRRVQLRVSFDHFHLRALIGAALILAAAPRGAAAPLVDVRSIEPSIRVELSYASPDNAFRKQFYRRNSALLREPVARRLARVQHRLRERGLGLKVWDAYRPRSVQSLMWKARPDARRLYLANPRRTSKHNRGAAVDLTLVDRDGRELPMPTPHDEFSPRAHRNATKGVSAAARKNRELLIDAMRAEGFRPNPYEWWHFNAPDWSRYPVSDQPL